MLSVFLIFVSRWVSNAFAILERVLFFSGTVFVWGGGNEDTLLVLGVFSRFVFVCFADIIALLCGAVLPKLV